MSLVVGAAVLLAYVATLRWLIDRRLRQVRRLAAEAADDSGRRRALGRLGRLGEGRRGPE